MARTGRPREFDEDAVVARATEVFWERGYGATSMQDLVDALGVQRGSLYGTFGSKRSLLLLALAHYRAEVARRLAALEGPGPVLPALRAFLAAPLGPRAAPLGAGCLMGNTALELAPEDTEIADAVREGFAALENLLRRALTRAHDSGELPAGDPGTQARLLVTTHQGLHVLARTAPDPARLDDVVDAVLAALGASSPAMESDGRTAPRR